MNTILSSFEGQQVFMPVLSRISKEIVLRRPLVGAKISVVFHLTDPVAYMVLTLMHAGAEIFFIPSKKETTAPSALAMLEHLGVRCENPGPAEKEQCLRQAIAFQPHLIIDNVDLFKLLHTYPLSYPVLGSTVHSKSAYDLVEQHWESGKPLFYPVIGIGASEMKLELESALGTGQSVINALLAITKLQLSGKKLAVVGYGYVGSGIARAAKAMGARVLVVGRSAYPLLKAHLVDGLEVTNLEEAVSCCDILLTATGGKNILTERHFHLLKDGVFIGNAGRYPEIDQPGLEKAADHFEEIDDHITRYVLAGKHIYLLGRGRQFNLTAGMGNSSEIMDLSLALHVLSIEYLWKNHRNLEPKIYPVPPSITNRIATAKLLHSQNSRLEKS